MSGHRLSVHSLLVAKFVALAALGIVFSPDVVLAQSLYAAKKGQRMLDPVAFNFPGYDQNGDGKLDRTEWNHRGNFELLDVDKDGYIDRDEMAAMYGKFGEGWVLSNPVLPGSDPHFDPSVETDRVDKSVVGQRSVCVVSRNPQCENVDVVASHAGLMETGMGPAFPVNSFCLGVDETFAEPYTDKTGKGMHGGVDIPTGFNTPILAIAAGTVVAKVDDVFQARGRAVILRHSPEDTGLPFWVYTEYAHMNELPTQAIGQRVKMGEVLGPTGNSGVKPGSSSSEHSRRPAIHFAVYYTPGPKYFVGGKYVFPEKVRWMDPHALYRQRAPFDSASLSKLPDEEKAILVPVMYVDGTTEPKDTKLIWPYACRRTDLVR